MYTMAHGAPTPTSTPTLPISFDIQGRNIKISQIAACPSMTAGFSPVLHLHTVLCTYLWVPTLLSIAGVCILDRVKSRRLSITAKALNFEQTREV